MNNYSDELNMLQLRRNSVILLDIASETQHSSTWCTGHANTQSWPTHVDTTKSISTL